VPESALQVARDNYVAVRQEVSDKATSQLMQLLPPEKAARFVQTGLRALSKNPDLLQCTPKSLANAFYDAAVLDLEPVLGSVYFVKYGTDATMMIGYKGLVDLAKRGDPSIEDIYGQAVYEGDAFDYAEGTDPFIAHKPSLERKVADPTKITHFYAIAFRSGHRRPVFTVMTKTEVDDIRARSKAKNAGPWVSDYPAMGQKTAVRRLCVRRLSLAATIKEAIERDDDREYGQAAAPVAPAARTTSLRDALAAQADGLVSVEIEGEVVEVPVEQIANIEEVAEGAPVVLAPKPSAPEPTDEVCKAVSENGTGALCDRPKDHKGSHISGKAKNAEAW
jgi:recombination protein RecT